MSSDSTTISGSDAIRSQLWQLADILPPVLEMTIIDFEDSQPAIDELRLRIKAAMLEISCLRMEKLKLITALSEKR